MTGQRGILELMPLVNHANPRFAVFAQTDPLGQLLFPNAPTGTVAPFRDGRGDENGQTNAKARDFDVGSSRANEVLTGTYGPRAKEFLISLAKTRSRALDMALDRGALPRKDILLKWFDEHRDKIEPLV
jgi:hypothetical protein